jgi:copper oxidase (laccase) domain-containing protein
MLILSKENYKIYISEKKDNTARELKDFVYTYQVHGNSLHILDQAMDIIPSENDGIISKLSNIKI